MNLLQTVKLTSKAVICVVIASKAYQGNYQVEEMIRGLDRIESIPGILVFHVGTKLDN